MKTRKQPSLFQSVVLHLLPGALATVAYLGMATLAMQKGFPALLALLLAAGLVIVPFQLGYLLLQKRRAPDEPVIGLREPLPGWQYIVLPLGMLIWAFLASGALSLLDVYVAKAWFGWLPEWFFFLDVDQFVEARSSDRASLMIDQDDWRNRLAITAATAKSGQGVPVQATSPAATTTARFPIASLRLNSQTARTFASPDRCGISTAAAATFTISAITPKMPMMPASGWCSTSTRYAVVARTPMPSAPRNRPCRSAARARHLRLQPIASRPRKVIEPSPKKSSASALSACDPAIKPATISATPMPTFSRTTIHSARR